MSLVNALRFSKYDGAMISDEEYWLHGRRRTFFLDNLHFLLPASIANHSGVELLYGGAGDPYLHYEIMTKSRAKLSDLMASGVIKGDDSPVYEAAKHILKVAQSVTKIHVEQKLRFLYGFGVDDFNRGYYEKNGKKYQIKQKCVRDKALNFISWADKNKKMSSVFESRGLIMGCDPDEGVQLFYLNLENQVLSFNSGDYDTIGTGIYGAGHVFANYMKRKTMDKRLGGFPRVEGMVALIESALVASQTYKEVGGYFNIVYLDARETCQEKRLKHIFEERAKLSTEIVAAKERGLINTKLCHELVEALIFSDASVNDIDDELFQKCAKPKILEMYLRGYKLDMPYDTISHSVESEKKMIGKQKSKHKNSKKGGVA